MHANAISEHIPTISVLASDLQCMRPISNQSLFDSILIHQGLIISEYPVGVVTKPYHFLQRNRIIAALSQKVLVVEAGKRSGASATASLAAEFGADVGAMIGSFNAPQNAGCHDLINDGAVLIGDIATWHDFIGSNRGRDTLDLPTHPLLQLIPFSPVHIDDLQPLTGVSQMKLIEELTQLALNKHIMFANGNYVVRI